MACRCKRVQEPPRQRTRYPPLQVKGGLLAAQVLLSPLPITLLRLLLFVQPPLCPPLLLSCHTLLPLHLLQTP